MFLLYILFTEFKVSMMEQIAQNQEQQNQNNLRNNVQTQGRLVLFSGPLVNTGWVFTIIINSLITYALISDISNAGDYPLSYSLLLTR